MALVVYVFATVLMLAAGLEQTLVATGQPDNVIVIRRGSQTEVQSGIDRASAAIVETQPDIATGEDGSTLLSKEPVVLINLPKRETGKPSNVVIRGVTAHGLALRPQVKIVEGRMFRPGTSEIIAGRAIAQGFRGAAHRRDAALRAARLDGGRRVRRRAHRLRLRDLGRRRAAPAGVSPRWVSPRSSSASPIRIASTR